MSAIPTDLRAKLSSSQTFQEAAETGLGAMLKIVADAVSRSSYKESATILRGTAHLRSGDAYQGVAVRNWAEGPAAIDDVVPSATLWGALKESKQAIALDVVRGAQELVRPGSRGRTPVKMTSDGGRRDPVGSFLRLQKRDVTHVLALPVVVDKVLRGMLSLEVKSRVAIGEEFIWTECIQTLQIITSMMGPALVSLPVTADGGEDTAPNESLPVLGASMRPRMDTLRALAQQEKATLLLAGPAGLGKEDLAHWCHEQSARREGPFEAIHLHGLSSEETLGRLFGVREGAYTGAQDSVGLVEEAQGGTLFIGDIDRLPVESQEAMLTFLSDFTYRPLGGGEGDERQADVRIIVATDRDLEGLVARGAFPESLYSRIQVLSFRVPPLAQRRDEIGDWARYLLEATLEEEEDEGTEAELSDDAIDALKDYGWPGNLSQLADVVDRAFLLAQARAVADGREGVVEIEQADVEAALLYDQQESGPRSYQLIEDAAEAFVTAVLAHNRIGQQPLTLDLLEGLGRLIVDGLMERGGMDLKEAFLSLGEEKTVEHRNHGRRYETLGQAAELLRRSLTGG